MIIICIKFLDSKYIKDRKMQHPSYVFLEFSQSFSPQLAVEARTFLKRLRRTHGLREDQVARFLQQKATMLDSRMLSALAVRVAADPLAKAGRRAPLRKTIGKP